MFKKAGAWLVTNVLENVDIEVTVEDGLYVHIIIKWNDIVILDREIGRYATGETHAEQTKFQTPKR